MERAAVPGMNREQRLNRWIEDYSDPILRTCFLYLSDHSQAEDATQDTWIKAWKHMDDFEKNNEIGENETVEEIKTDEVPVYEEDRKSVV